MGLRNLTTVLVRLYGLLLLFYFLQASEHAFIYAYTSSDSVFKIGLITSISIGALYGVVGIGLLVFAKTISGWIAPVGSGEFNINVTVEDLGIVGFSIVGIVLFVDGVRWLINDAIIWQLTPKPVDSTLSPDARMTASIIVSGIKAAAGLFLVLGSRGVLRVIRWAQGERGYEFKTNGRASQTTVDMPGFPKCPSCGEEYDATSYRQDALEWLCSNCGAVLPKE